MGRPAVGRPEPERGVSGLRARLGGAAGNRTKSARLRPPALMLRYLTPRFHIAHAVTISKAARPPARAPLECAGAPASSARNGASSSIRVRC